MAFVTIYQLEFKNNEDQTVTINVSDTNSGTTGTPLYIPLTCTGAVLKVVNDADDKFSIIKGKALEFSFLSDPLHGLTTFIGSQDNQWLVEVFVNANPVFSGYLVTDATRENFLPPKTYTVQLAASDNIALLKNIPLTKPDGTNPRGMFRLIDYISWCLRKTGFDFPINVVYNLLPDNLTSTDHAFDAVYLNSKSFEAEINTSIDCYSVLEHILKGCFLTQENNEWWIVRIDEINDSDLRVAHYTFDGTLGTITTVALSKNIGKTETIKFIGKDAEVMPERPVLYDKLKYRFEFPREIVDNIDFSRGTTWVSPYVVDMGFYIKSYATLGAFPTVGEFDLVYKATGSGIHYKWTAAGYVALLPAEVPVGKGYDFDDWTRKKGNPDSPTTAPMSAFVVKIEQYGSEKTRYVILTDPTVASVTRSYMESNPIPVGRYDKFVTSVDFRFPTNITNGGAPFYVIMAVRLKGEDGSNWWLGKGLSAGTITPEKWYPSNSTWSNNSFQPGPAIPLAFNGSVDTREWQSVSWDAPPVPVNGDIYIQLCAMNSQSNAASTWDDTDIHYANLQFQYTPYINGSYQKYNGQYNKVSQSISTKANLEEDVETADSPKKLFKGALMLKTAGGQYYLTSNWYNFNAGTTGELGIASFGKYQAFEYWNHNRRIIRKFQGSLIGLDSATQLPGLLHKYIITTINDHTTNKRYFLLSYNQDLDTCKWSGVFAEVFDTVEDKIYNSDHEFKYTSE